jgi:hypothetical protein
MHASADADRPFYATTTQPPGIVDNWESDPFEPAERGGRLFDAAAPTTRRAASRTRTRCRRG